ncbi:MAG TPA: thymidylate synthase [Pseudoneobacillus sp.]|nr:thymidylate synthase [Pseudoneobacillus sp.]
MYIIKGKSFAEVYKKSIMEILREGQEVSPRGSATFELAPATIVIEDARQFLAAPQSRKGNHTFQLAEALWMLRGSDDLDEIAHYNKVWRNFEDEDYPGILNGAYGGRLRAWNGEIDQLIEVYIKLKDDPNSRQATVVIWDPERDNDIHSNGKYSKDIPCTNYFNFQIRDGKLNMLTVMRSNDLHKGTIYDIPNFIIFQHILAGWLDVEVGKYTHVAASLHIYESDIENLIGIYNDKEDIEVYDGKDYGDPRMSFKEFNDVMQALEVLEHESRTMELPEFEIYLEPLKNGIESIKNSWWRSVAAQIVMYNYRKAGATEEEFNVFLPYITNEYRKTVENWKKLNTVTAV